MEQLSWDVLVVGSGAAGLRAAIAAREQGVSVCVVCKGMPGGGTSTVLAGGVCGSGGEGDKGKAEHRRRTLKAGRGINQPELVDILIEEGPARLNELLAWGLEGELRRGYLYAYGRPGVWGEGIVRCLLARAQGLGVEFMGGITMAALRVEAGASAVLAYSVPRQQWLILSSKATVLATGGAGALYLRHDNPPRMMGEGYAAALEAGATLQDMEFVQFYPLGLAEPPRPPLLIPPGLGDLGRLYNSRGEEILAKYEIRERPAAERERDRLSHELFREIEREGGKVWLDLSGVSDEAWESSDPLSASTRESLGERCEARHRPICVAPMAHHVMGGLCIDGQGQTTLPGLFAAGEVTGGLHGANRLGGNALTETLVFGARTGRGAADWAKAGSPPKPAVLSDLQDSAERFAALDRPTYTRLKESLRPILWKEGGIIRNRRGLQTALDRLSGLTDEGPRPAKVEDPRDQQRGVELQLGLRTAAIILQGALGREESRGAHFREDHPEQSDHWRGHLQVALSANGREQWNFVPSVGTSEGQ
jgi:succinate dehydrogenase/fumarate reductase flavoprotein subunit